MAHLTVVSNPRVTGGEPPRPYGAQISAGPGTLSRGRGAPAPESRSLRQRIAEIWHSFVDRLRALFRPLEQRASPILTTLPLPAVEVVPVAVAEVLLPIARLELEVQNAEAAAAKIKVTAPEVSHAIRNAQHVFYKALHAYERIGRASPHRSSEVKQQMQTVFSLCDAVDFAGSEGAGNDFNVSRLRTMITYSAGDARRRLELVRRHVSETGSLHPGIPKELVIKELKIAEKYAKEAQEFGQEAERAKKAIDAHLEDMRSITEEIERYEISLRIPQGVISAPAA